MTADRTGAGDPARTLALLWRHEVPLPRRRGPRPAFSVDDVVTRAITIADGEGLDAVTMRRLAGDLGVSPMALYGYVPGKAELLDLMLDDRYAAMPRPAHGRAGWRRRLRTVAEANRDLYAAHPWAALVSTGRPPLGPGLMAKYEHELAAVEGTGLDDVEMDAAITLIVSFTRANALDAAAARAALTAGRTDAEWWEENAPLLDQVLDPARYPLASRVGTAAGEAHGAAHDSAHAFAFGLERILDGIAALIDDRRS